MEPTRVKICGITRPQDAETAIAAGADQIGMILQAPGSKRLISIDEARRIVEVVPPAVQVVGVFADADPKVIVEMAQSLKLAAVQLHGHESPAMVKELRPLRVIKVMRVQAETLGGYLREARRAFSPWPYTNMAALLLDTHAEGGSGLANDWETIARHVTAGDFGDLPWIAAGGLTPLTVGEVVTRLRPWGVDVSSGVESGLREKSAEKVRAFIRAVRDADAAKAGRIDLPGSSS
jgi:phosphoribosylanthranilate isomerase